MQSRKGSTFAGARSSISAQRIACSQNRDGAPVGLHVGELSFHRREELRPPSLFARRVLDRFQRQGAPRIEEQRLDEGVERLLRIVHLVAQDLPDAKEERAFEVRVLRPFHALQIHPEQVAPVPLGPVTIFDGVPHALHGGGLRCPARAGSRLLDALIARGVRPPSFRGAGLRPGCDENLYIDLARLPFAFPRRPLEQLVHREPAIQGGATLVPLPWSREVLRADSVMIGATGSASNCAICARFDIEPPGSSGCDPP